jgi:LmbE family N-acetylglucosaminyl deacetylase
VTGPAWQALWQGLAGQGEVAAAGVALVAAHPDDETIGLGGQLQRLRGLRLIHVTDGAPRAPADHDAAALRERERYAARRRQEARAAAAMAGIAPERHVALGIVDQEAAGCMAELAQRLAGLFRGDGTRIVVTHAYEGGHPDHDACCFAVHAAAALLRRDGPAAPAVVEMALYHAGPGGALAVGRFLPAPGCPELALPLDEAARRRKQALYRCHASQAGVLADFPVGEERLRLAPAYDFRVPPHPGPLHYERRGDSVSGGVTGPGWRVRAAMARDALGLDPPPWA